MKSEIGCHTGEVIDIVGGVEIIECKNCGFRHVYPVPSEEELAHIYNHEYYTKEKPLYLERFLEDLDWWMEVYNERYDIFEELLSADQRSLLEIGSGPGYFLLCGQERGWKTLGIEPSAQAVAHSRDLGVDVQEEFFNDHIAVGLGTFDVVHMYNVVEHVPNPEKLLRLAHKNLEPDGVLCLSVPNDYNPFQLALREACDFQPWWVVPPHHLNYFNFDSLSALLERLGFEVILRDTSFPIDLFLLMGENYIGNDTLGRKCHSMRMQFEKNLSRAGRKMIKQQLYRAMAEIGLGREIVLYARPVSI